MTPLTNAAPWDGWISCSTATRPTLVRGQGCYVWDAEGRRYFDGMAAASNTPFGHAHPTIARAIATQLDTGLAHFAATAARVRASEELAAALGALTPGDLNQFVWVNSGSEAMEAAVRIALDYWHLQEQPQRNGIITFAHGYHGTTAVTQSLSGITGLGPDWPSGLNVRHVRFCNDHQHAWPATAEALTGRFAAEIDAINPKQVAAVIVEPFLNVGGGVVLPAGFLDQLRELTARIGCLLIVDEVFTGYGRSGQLFASTSLAVAPDILTASKGMTGGYIPMGAACVSDRIRRAFEGTTLRYGHTTSGHAVACAAALATLDLLGTDVLHQAAAAAAWFASHFAARFLDIAHVNEARTYGVVGIVEFDTDRIAAAVAARALTDGLILTRNCRSLLLVPALTATVTELEAMTALLHNAARSHAAEIH